MDNNKKIISAILLTIVLTFILTLIDSDFDISHMNQFFIPAIFAVAFSLSFFYSKTRKYLLIASFGSLFLMLFFYLTGQLDVANWFGSLGFGLLIFILISYLPKLFNQGYIERF